MIQMRREITVPMAPGSDMEVALHLVAFQATVDTTRVDQIATAQPRALGELLARVATHLVQDVVNVRVLLLLGETVGILMAESLILAGTVVALIHPQLPASLFLLEELAGENPVPGRVLDIDMQGIAGHLDDDVQVQLEVM